MTCGSDLPYLVSDFSGDWMITRNHVRVVDLYRWPMIPVNSFVSIFSIGWRQHHLLYYLRDVNVLLAASFLPDDCENMCTPSYYNYQREIWTQPMFRVGPWIKSAIYVLLYSQEIAINSRIAVSFAPEFLANPGSSIGLLPGGTKMLPKPMLTYNQWQEMSVFTYIFF